jgi:hypothetical protein
VYGSFFRELVSRKSQLKEIDWPILGPKRSNWPGLLHEEIGAVSMILTEAEFGRS